MDPRDALYAVGCRWEPGRRLFAGPLGPVRVSVREAALVDALVAAGGGTVAREELLRDPVFAGDRSVDFAVRRLRAKIERDPDQPTLVLTVHGLGYRLGIGRPTATPTPAREVVEVGDRSVDLDLGRVRVGDRTEQLTTLELEVLRALVDAAPHPVARDAVTTAPRGASRRRRLDGVVARLRSVLEVDPAEPVHLLTVRDVGYRLEIGRPPTNLRPSAGVPLVGREAEVEVVRASVAANRWTLLVGPAGVGKTRIAEAVAWSLVGERPGGVWWVDCAAHTTARGVLGAILEALGSASAASPTPRAIDAVLGRREALVLVLDNLEQVDGIDQALTELLRACPAFRALGTSSRRLEAGGQVVAIDGLAAQAGAALYHQVVASLGHPLPAGEDAAVARLVEALEGHPLGIEIAASRALVWPPSTLVGSADRMGRLVRAGGGRHGSVRAALDRAWHLASAEERRALVGCLVFRDPATLEALAAVAGVGAGAAAGLVDRCLLVRVDGPGEPAFRLYSLVRDYVAERSAPDPLAADAHARWFHDRMVRWTPWIRSSRLPEVRRGSTRHLRDLEAAAEHLIGRGDAEGAEQAAAIALGLSQCAWIDAGVPQGLVERVLATPHELPSRGALHLRQGWWYIWDPIGYDRAVAAARAAGVTDDTWELRHLRCVHAQNTGLVDGVDPGEPCPPDSLDEIHWLRLRGRDLAARHRKREALAHFERASRLARRHGDSLAGDLVEYGLVRDLLWQLGHPPMERAERLERLAARHEADGLVRLASRAAAAAAEDFAQAGVLERALPLSRRAVALAVQADDPLFENRARLAQLRLDLPSEPERVVDRAFPLQQAALAQNDVEGATFAAIFGCAAAALIGDLDRAHRLADVAFAVPLDPELQWIWHTITGLLALVDESVPLPPLLPGTSFVVKLVVHHVDGVPMPPGPPINEHDPMVVVTRLLLARSPRVRRRALTREAAQAPRA